MKQQWKPGTMIYPLPAALVSCGTAECSNLITVGWTGTVCTDPAMCYISLRPERHSYQMVRDTMEFTVYLTTEAMARATDWCGVRSGRDYDKWAETGLTPAPGVMVGCPSVAEAPVSIECRVKQITHLGSHDMFLAQVLAVLADESLIDESTGAFRLDKAGLITYAHGQYFALGRPLGRFGWSVMKKKTAAKLKK